MPQLYRTLSLAFEHDMTSLWARDDAISFIREVKVFDGAGDWWSPLADSILLLILQKIPQDRLQRFEYGSPSKANLPC
jgi:hypothetical protein